MEYGIEVCRILCWTKPTGCLMLVSRMIFAGLSHTPLGTRKVDKLSCVSPPVPCPQSEFYILTIRDNQVSATWPESVRRLASTFLNAPLRITVGSDELSANKRIEQVVEVLDNPRDKE